MLAWFADSWNRQKGGRQCKLVGIVEEVSVLPQLQRSVGGKVHRPLRVNQAA